MKRFALHSREVTLQIAPNKSQTFTAEYPKDFGVLLKLLQKNDL
jgi:23S rRNA pseudouridine955/2504/2580 synthase